MATVPGSRDPEERVAGSQFLITLGDNLDYLDGKAAIFGKVVEGFDALERINDAFIDDKGRPLKDIRIRHTVVLEDPFPNPPGLVVPPESPLPSRAQLATVRIADDEEIDESADQETVDKMRREREARAQALTLEMVGDLPFAEVKPPENILFVCKLNPVTQGWYLKCFCRYGSTNCFKMRTWTLSSVVLGKSYRVKSFETKERETACNMPSSSLKIRKTASRHISRCKAF